MSYKRSKYRVRIDEKGKEDRTVDNICFGSKKEADYYRLVLKPLLRAETITDLKIHERIPLVVHGMKVCDIEPDFMFRSRDGRLNVHDTKGYKGGAAYQVFKIKAALYEALSGIRIVEV